MIDWRLLLKDCAFITIWVKQGCWGLEGKLLVPMESFYRGKKMMVKNLGLNTDSVTDTRIYIKLNGYNVPPMWLNLWEYLWVYGSKKGIQTTFCELIVGVGCIHKNHMNQESNCQQHLRNGSCSGSGWSSKPDGWSRKNTETLDTPGSRSKVLCCIGHGETILKSQWEGIARVERTQK